MLLVIAGTNAGPPSESAAAETRIVTTRQNRQRGRSKGIGRSRDPSRVDDVLRRMKALIIMALETDCGEDARMRPL